MSTAQEWPDLTPTQIGALVNFIKRWGRTWKNELSLQWSVGVLQAKASDNMEAHALYCLRNTHGPRWLYSPACKKALAPGGAS